MRIWCCYFSNFGSDCWRISQFYCLHLCSCCACDTSWSIEYNCQVILCFCFLCFSLAYIFCPNERYKFWDFVCHFSAVLAHFLLKEKLRRMGILGCVLCVVGSTVIVLHAPSEHSINSVEEIWELAIQPGKLIFAN